MKYNMLNKIQKEINKLKKKLISEVQERGIYENFGQKEITQLKDKFEIYTIMCNTDLSLAERNNILDCVYSFENWCENYNG